MFARPLWPALRLRMANALRSLARRPQQPLPCALAPSSVPLQTEGNAAVISELQGGGALLLEESYQHK